MKKSLLLGAIIASGMSTAHATPIDLSSWTKIDLNFPTGQNASNWVLSPGNTEVTQTVNADPSFYLNNTNQTNYSIDGSWQVTSGTGDDDYIGFVFGYQNSSNFYSFDWKQSSQDYNGTTAAEGMTVKKFTGATGDGLVDLSHTILWENTTDLADMTILGANQSSSAGWVTGTTYEFHLDFNLTAGEFSIVIMDGATELWNVTIDDATFTSGQFGFYNYSQGNVKYTGFTQTTGGGGGTPTVSEPAILSLLSLGLLGVITLRRRKRSS